MIMGLDLATRCCGVTIGDGSRMPGVGVWTFDFCGDDLGVLLEAYEGSLSTTAAIHGTPTHVIYESPILLPSDKLLTLRKIYSLGAYTELWCRKRNIVCEEASAKALKKRLTGDHRADKAEMVRMCRQLGVRLPPGDAAKDAADSFAAWLVGLTHHGDRAHLTRWDQALYSKRGFAL